MVVENSGQIIAGKRLYLRRIRVTDANVLLKWGQDEHYHQLAGFEKLTNSIEALKAAKQYAARVNSYAICLNNHKMIGLVELYERGLDLQGGLLQTKELGFLLDKDYERRGYMTEALQLIINYAFSVQKQKEIWAGTFSDNLRSQHLLEKIGFKYLYTSDYSQISSFFAYQEKYYLLKRQYWLKIEPNAKS